MSKVRLTLFIFFLCFRTYAQDYGAEENYLIDNLDLSSVSSKDKALIDSVLSLFNNCKNEVCKARAVNIIVQESWDANVWPKYNRWIYDYTEQRLAAGGLDSAITAGLRVSYAGAVGNIGFLFNSKDETDSALFYYDKCLAIQNEMNDKPGMAGTLINTGYIFLNKGLIEKALDYYYQSLSIYEEIGEQDGISTALNGIGYMQYKLEDIESALKSYNRSLIIRRERKNDYGTATSLNNIGLIFKDKGQWSKALEYFEEGLAIERKLSDKSGIAISLSNIGYVYKGMGEAEKALSNYEQSLQIMGELEDKSGIASGLNSIAGIELTKGNLKKGRTYALRSLKIAEEIKFPAAIRDAAETLHQLARKMGQWKEALSYYELYVEMRDSVFNEETVTASIHEQYKYQYERQYLSDSIRNANLQEIQEAELIASEAETERLGALSAKQTQQTYFLIFGVFTALVFSATMFNRLRFIKQQKETISEQNEELELQKKNLTNFAHTISHDLKTPIGGIEGLINLIEYENPSLPGNLKQRFDLIKQSAQESHKLIDGVLAYSEAGRTSLELSTNNLNELLDDLIKEIPNSNNTSVKVESVLPTIRCNTYQISQVFMNLIGNAIKYNHRENGEGLVSIHYSPITHFHQFTIKDNGPGIPINEQSSVFEIFKKGQHAKDVDSTGIGLSIVQQLISQNGGTIELDQKHTEGAAFTFTWPTNLT